MEENHVELEREYERSFASEDKEDPRKSGKRNIKSGFWSTEGKKRALTRSKRTERPSNAKH